MVVLALSRGHPVLPPPLSLSLPYDIAARLEGKHCTPDNSISAFHARSLSIAGSYVSPCHEDKGCRLHIC